METGMVRRSQVSRKRLQHQTSLTSIYRLPNCHTRAFRQTHIRGKKRIILISRKGTSGPKTFMNTLNKNYEIYFFNYYSENYLSYIFTTWSNPSLNPRVQYRTCAACLLALCCTPKPQQLILLGFYWSRRHYTRLQAPSSSCLVK